MLKLKIILLLGVMLLPGALTAGPLFPGSGWQTFSFGLAPSQALPSYELPGGHFVGIHVVSCCTIGDQLAIYIDGTWLYDTNLFLVNDGLESGAQDGDTAWAHPDLGKASIRVGPGVHQIDVWVIRNASGTDGGGGFIRADVSEAPEPGTFGLLGLALVGLAAMVIRRGK